MKGQSISRAEYARRRRQLMRMAGEDAALLVASAPQRMRNADAAWPYRQDSDFHYLTGYPEPEAVLALLPGRSVAESVLFCRERDPQRERMDGPRLGTEGAVETCGVDDAFPIEDIDDILPGMLEGRARVYCQFGQEPEFDARLLAWMRRLRALRGGGVVPKDFLSLGYLLHDMRLFKSRAELSLMRRCAAVSVNAHRAAMACTRPGVAEFEVEAELLRVMRAQGAVSAYMPSVAGGVNACTMHYNANQSRLRDGDLLLIDAGAEVECYATDITRTFPVNGRFTRDQRALYDVVLTAQQAAIEQVRPGQPFSAAHEAAVEVIAEGLKTLKLLNGSLASILANASYKRFFPHKTGHWLGLDVHDVGDYRIDGEPRMLEPGMVVTVEPGVYIPADDQDVDPRWRGIGIRIEDDVVTTRDGVEVLTDAVPREAGAIEDMLSEARKGA
ncbi:aminopeptidase P N-terminal domain-containing protein [Oleiagrimonas sp.]|uniref:aminopeptidase P N-terminal domain-containing protein n=1 Tax=Oleiagrimonas sp. TaxID=2010330 RepID=UPI0026221A9E|nr:aminopeptidase P N-terminal domain-containing protein [Oleiagrimonas sp.]MDA3913626.1 aminopeptidase P N-terminal domain-containing protein [Oleiagrimonas sp.]